MPKKSSVDIPERLVSRFGEDVDKIVKDILNKRAEKLKLVQEIREMDLPVDDWQKMEEETIQGATE